MTAAAKTKNTLLSETRVWASNWTASDHLDRRFPTSQFGGFNTADPESHPLPRLAKNNQTYVFVHLYN